MDGLCFQYGEGDSSTPVIKDSSWDMEPGALVALSSNGPGGKATMLRLLARRLVPTKGFVYYPENWRIRFLDEVELFDWSLLENLRFGNNFEHKDSEIWSLCENLGLSKQLIGNGNFQVGKSGTQLAMSDRVIVTVVRQL